MHPQTRMSLSAMKADGGTSIADGLRCGAAILTARRTYNKVSSLLLLSDGQNSDPNYQLDEIFPALKKSEASVHTIGFGEDHDAAFLSSIAQKGGGAFTYVPTESAIREGFAMIVGGLLTTSATRLQLVLKALEAATFDDGAAGINVIRSIKHGGIVVTNKEAQSAKELKLDMSELISGEERDIFIEMDIAALGDPSAFVDSTIEQKLLQAYCSYIDTTSGRLVSTVPASVHLDRTLARTASNPTPTVKMAHRICRLKAAEAML